jgi:D-sedoheptulose 7-phosphate isomerase
MSRVPKPASPGIPGDRPPGTAQSGAAPAVPGSIESLYPFIFEGVVDPAQVVAQACQSTVAKTREIIDLRAEVAVRGSDLLASSALAMAARFAAGGRLLAFGNGGSATDAADLVTLFLNPPAGAPSLPAMSLASDVSVLTALANDIGVEVVFARQVTAFGQAADIAVGLSTSGNSENLLLALDEAHHLGMLTIGISGYNGGKMAELPALDYLFIAPSESIHRIQEVQTTIYHILWELVVAEMTRSPATT